MFKKNISKIVVEFLSVLALALVGFCAVQTTSAQTVQASTVSKRRINRNAFSKVKVDLNGAAVLYENPFIPLNKQKPAQFTNQKTWKVNMRVVDRKDMVWYRTSDMKWIPSDLTNHPQGISLKRLAKHASKKIYFMKLGKTTFGLKKSVYQGQPYYYVVCAVC